MAKKYYDISAILETGAQYMLLLGQRANGKSYQAKLTAVRAALNGRPFVYLRRWRADITPKSVASYFGDVPLESLVGDEWEYIQAGKGEIYLASRDEKGKEIHGPVLGRYCALNESERYKSQTFVDYQYIIYEEFITDKTYIPDEPRLLQQFVSTVARDRTVTVIMVGNTLSRVCPYFSEWCLENVLKQKQGTIEIYHFHTDDGTVDVAVEYCATAKSKNTMFFGQAAKQIITGEWDTVAVPKLMRKQYEYEKVYELLVEYQKFKFVIELLVENQNGGKLCFVYPFTGARHFDRIITDRFDESPFISSRLDVTKRPEQYIRECFQLNKVCYSDNLTGSDFKHVMDTFRFN